MKILIAIVLLSSFLNTSAYIAGRLDSFKDIGYIIPKNVYQLNENIYLRTYFDIINETVTDISVNDFTADLWDGSSVVFYSNSTYFPVYNQVYLIIGDRPNDNIVSI